MSSQDYSTILRLPSSDSEEQVKLTPIDLHHSGMIIPFTYFYKETMDVERLMESLVKTLEYFPLFCGRYVGRETEREGRERERDRERERERED